MLRFVVICHDCWLCADCFINPGTILPEGSVVFPKAVVGRMRFPPYSVLGGNHAQVLAPLSRLGFLMDMSQSPEK